MTRVSLARGIAALKRRDPSLRRLITTVGTIRHQPRNPDGGFGALARAIVFQQLAGAAARAILSRVIVAVGGRLTPDALAATADADLRAAGLSGNKLASLRDLTAKVCEGAVDLHATSRQSDEEIIERLTTIRGIGRWTAEMYLMFELRRLDVWPVDDLGVRQGHALIWGVALRPRELLPLGDRFRPYRSIVARYCWEAVALERRGVPVRAIKGVRLEPSA